ncbi:MAG: SAM-dependent chlorinase/fluorinase [Deltaproteobacteria bacterium]|nr:SAM-dependent chlorinase/fluorinase [Deltaproteobacteria bacterium]
MSPPITLLTDFGYKDHYLGVMKGVILTINPSAMIVDISHSVSPHNILEGALILSNAFRYFPEGTIHVAVVDPGVGTERKAIVVSGDGYLFVGPDNGVFGLLYGQFQHFSVFELTNPSFFRSTVSATFQGRDVFAPVAAYLSNGVLPAEMGRETPKYRSLSIPVPIVRKETVTGLIILSDGFGNLLTNIDRYHLQKLGDGKKLRIAVGKNVIAGISPNYQTVGRGELLAVIGSSDLLEISIREGNARETLGLKQGDQVVVCR